MSNLEQHFRQSAVLMVSHRYRRPVYLPLIVRLEIQAHDIDNIFAPAQLRFDAAQQHVVSFELPLTGVFGPTPFAAGPVTRSDLDKGLGPDKSAGGVDLPHCTNTRDGSLHEMPLEPSTFVRPHAGNSRPQQPMRKRRSS